MAQQSSSSQSSDWLEIINGDSVKIQEGGNILNLKEKREKFDELPEDRQKSLLNSYFNGCDPDWGRIQSGKIPEREIVAKVIKSLGDIKSDIKDNEVIISSILLHGATGEGKTTALMQVASQLSNPSEDWKIYWRKSSLSPDCDGLSKLAKEIIQKKIDENIEDDYFLFICDQAEQIFDDIYTAMMTVYDYKDKLENSQFCFLLCCRTTEWNIEKEQIPVKFEKRFKKYQSIPDFLDNPILLSLEDLSEEDAVGIVTAWHENSDESQSKMQNIDLILQQKAKQLLRAANPLLVIEDENNHSLPKRPNQDEPIKRYNEQYASVKTGTFFGAILYVRFEISKGDESFKKRLRSLMRTLEKKRIELDNGRKESGILLKIFVCIVAFEKERQCIETQNNRKSSPEYRRTILEKAPLAHHLKCQQSELDELVELLGQEVPISTSSDFLFTRHPMIADITFKIIEEFKFSSFKTNSAIDKIYLDLLEATFEVFLDQKRNYSYLSSQDVSNIECWNFLSRYFFFKRKPRNRNLGLRLAQLAYQKEDDNVYLITTLGEIYGANGSPEKSQQLFRESAKKVNIDDVFYCQWGKTEGNQKNYQLDIWLNAIPLFDSILEELNEEQMKKRIPNSLKGLCRAFYDLSNSSQNSSFIQAACSALYLRKKLSYKKNELDDLEEKLKKANFQPESEKEALELINTGVKKVWEEAQKQAEEAIDYILNLDYLKFDKLGEYFGVYTSSSATVESQQVPKSKHTSRKNAESKLPKPIPKNQKFVKTKISDQKWKKNYPSKKTGSHFTEDVVLSRPDRPKTTQKETKPMSEKPKIFIGSSNEGLDIARAISEQLNDMCTVEIWKYAQLFESGSYPLEALQEAVTKYQFGVFVFTPDDELFSRDSLRQVARDNVIFETGVFMGKLGRDKVHIVCPKNKVYIPSDLGAITLNFYDSDHAKNNETAAVTDACTKIRRQIRKLIS